MATSYNGWPGSPDPGEIGIDYHAEGADVKFPGGIKGGDVATVLGYVADQLHARVEPVTENPDGTGYGCWGYTYKQNVNNPSSLSCHASGTAIDWIAPSHPNGSGGTFSPQQEGTIYAILDECQGGVSWLEGYDEMHFEICVEESTLAGIAASLGGSTPPSSGTGTPPTTGDWFDQMDEATFNRILDEKLAPIKGVTDALGSNVHVANTVADVLSGAQSAPKAAQLWEGPQYQNALAVFADRKIPGAAERP